MLAITAMSIVSALGVASPAFATAAPEPTINYTMNNTLNGLTGTPALAAAPACSSPTEEEHCSTSTNYGSDSEGNFFHWVTTQGNGGGVVVTTSQPLGATYTLTFKFAVDEFSQDEDMAGEPSNGYSKLVDFANLTHDDGLYFNNADPHYITTNPTGGDGTYATGTVVTVTMVRDSSGATPTFTVYVKDAATGLTTQIDAEEDPSGTYLAADYSGGSILRLFQDEPETATDGVSHEGVKEGRLYGVTAWAGTALTQEQIGGLVLGSTGSGNPDTLANTGLNTDLQLFLAAGLSLAGSSVLFVTRRRRN